MTTLVIITGICTSVFILGLMGEQFIREWRRGK
jgi:hypothetical protein